MERKKLKPTEISVEAHASEGINRIPESNYYGDRLETESQIILNQLPAVIWDHEHVASHLADNPDNLETLINSSPFFRELYKDKRVLFLSKKVLKILYEWLCNENHTPGKLYQQRFNDLLKWRRVCSSWCLSFDQLVKEDLFKCDAILKNPYKFKDRSEVYKFVEQFGDCPTPNPRRNPFVGGFLHLASTFVETVDQNCDEFYSLLRLYGHHIHHFKMAPLPHDTCEMTASGERPVQFFQNFTELLKLMPHITCINIDFSCYISLPSGYLAENPPPRLDHLKGLSHRAFHVPDGIVNYLGPKWSSKRK